MQPVGFPCNLVCGFPCNLVCGFSCNLVCGLRCSCNLWGLHATWCVDWGFPAAEKQPIFWAALLKQDKIPVRQPGQPAQHLLWSGFAQDDSSLVSTPEGGGGCISCAHRSTGGAHRRPQARALGPQMPSGAHSKLTKLPSGAHSKFTDALWCTLTAHGCPQEHTQSSRMPTGAHSKFTDALRCTLKSSGMPTGVHSQLTDAHRSTLLTQLLTQLKDAHRCTQSSRMPTGDCWHPQVPAYACAHLGLCFVPWEGGGDIEIMPVTCRDTNQDNEVMPVTCRDTNQDVEVMPVTCRDTNQVVEVMLVTCRDTNQNRGCQLRRN